MKEGAWIVAANGQYSWITEHARWLQDASQARALGLPEDAIARINSIPWDFNGPGRVAPPPVQYLVRLPGFSEPFQTRHMCFDPGTGTLFVATPEVVAFHADDETRVEVADLDPPVEMREAKADGAWLEMAMWEFISLLRLACSLLDEGQEDHRE